MSAFQAYAGVYETRDRSFDWRCYATARVYAVLRPDEAPAAPPAEGRKWLRKSPSPQDGELLWLVDDGVEDFSQILVQVVVRGDPVRRPAARRSPHLPVTP